ncbi:IS5/IS1182 family transposase, partial [Staphylococcus epidermidis]|nr:IS5/IS1182 family transposase [Staphylococcus epidermidis]MDS3968216.1 IS5/IS1182 family transposase [Staphylococcus epidermidis]
KVVAQRAENNQKIYKKDNFYIISIEIVFFSLIQELYVPDSLSPIQLEIGLKHLEVKTFLKFESLRV